MIRHSRFIRDAVKRIVNAAERSADDLHAELVEQEPQLTDRMLGRIAEAMNGYKTKGVAWTAKTLTDRGRNSQEKKYGPDFIGVLEINIRGYKVKKGFLAQAKLVKSGKMKKSEFRRMVKQCKQMLKLSSASFVFYQFSGGIRVIPAISIVGASDPDEVFNPTGVYSHGLSTFYENHFTCFVGDRAISDPSVKTLAELRAKYLLFLSAQRERAK